MTDNLLTALARCTDGDVERVERRREARTDLLVVYYTAGYRRDPIEIRIKDDEWDEDARCGNKGNVFDVTSQRLEAALRDSMTAT